MQAKKILQNAYLTIESNPFKKKEEEKTIEVNMMGQRSKQFDIKQQSLVGHGALEPELHGHSHGWTYVFHLHHGLGEVPRERLTADAILVHEIILQAITPSCLVTVITVVGTVITLLKFKSLCLILSLIIFEIQRQIKNSFDSN